MYVHLSHFAAKQRWAQRSKINDTSIEKKKEWKEKDSGEQSQEWKRASLLIDFPFTGSWGPVASCQQPDGSWGEGKVFAGRWRLEVLPLKPVALTRGASVLQDEDSQEETGGAGELPSRGLQPWNDTHYV